MSSGYRRWAVDDAYRSRKANRVSCCVTRSTAQPRLVSAIRNFSAHRCVEGSCWYRLIIHALQSTCRRNVDRAGRKSPSQTIIAIINERYRYLGCPFVQSPAKNPPARDILPGEGRSGETSKLEWSPRRVFQRYDIVSCKNVFDEISNFSDWSHVYRIITFLHGIRFTLLKYTNEISGTKLKNSIR